MQVIRGNPKYPNIPRVLSWKGREAAVTLAYLIFPWNRTHLSASELSRFPYFLMSICLIIYLIIFSPLSFYPLFDYVTCVLFCCVYNLHFVGNKAAPLAHKYTSNHDFYELGGVLLPERPCI